MTLSKVTCRFCFFISIWSQMAVASPFPGLQFARPELGLFWRSQGFELGTRGTPWKLEENHEILEVKAPLSASYFLELSPTAHFRIQLDPVKSKLSLENYTKKWARDYYHYGFEVISSRAIEWKGTRALVYDLKSKNEDLQLRQIVLLRDRPAGKAAVAQVGLSFTCSDQVSSFQKTEALCQRFLENLTWK